MRLCAAVDGRLRDFTGWIDPATGDTVVAGRRFRERFPAGSAGGRPWYERRDPLPLPYAPRYRPAGEPRELAPEAVARGLEVAHRMEGIDVFATLPRHADQRRGEATGTLCRRKRCMSPSTPAAASSATRIRPTSAP